MFKRTIICLTAVVAILGSSTVYGFSLNGPALGWDVEAYGYEPSPFAAGLGNYFPQNIGDENRVTVPNFFYACDQSFLDYFGEQGRQEVTKALNYFNDLPPFSTMSEDLSEFPQVTYRENFRANAMELTDIKSLIMNWMLMDFGLINPEYYMWGVRDRALLNNRVCPNYTWVLIVRNFDPVSWEPSSYVNGALYTYQWLLSCTPDMTIPRPLEIDPTAFGFSAVAGGNVASLSEGQYYNGFTRDDIGGLRYLYHGKNYNTEALPPNILAGGGGGTAWSIVGPNPTNIVGSTLALRGGVDKFTFEERPYDSLLSQFFVGFTNQFTASMVTNGTELAQTFGRPVLLPDIIFQADNNTVTVQDRVFPIGIGTPGFSNPGAGPGTIDIGGGVSLVYTLNKIGDAFMADNPFFLTEPELQPLLRWGSFDGTTNAPILYPSGASIRELEDLVLGQ